MKIIAQALALTALALVAAPEASAQANSGTVSYTCEGGRNLGVTYHFNSAGIPTQARLRLNGANRVLSYDMNRSDNVETSFKDRSGYTLSGEQMDLNNYRQSPVTVLSPSSQILYKGCLPNSSRNAGTASRPASSSQSRNSGSVAYRCQNNRRITVQYRFNAQGIPTHASAQLQGANRVLNYDQGASSDVETYFTGGGYRIGAGYLDINNYTHSDGINIYSPRSEILYKGCVPAN
ncbi:MAG: adhesin [Pseudomonadota bacterium]|nr:adhesin [Pseudomonadota bacterium]